MVVIDRFHCNYLCHNLSEFARLTCPDWHWAHNVPLPFTKDRFRVTVLRFGSFKIMKISKWGRSVYVCWWLSSLPIWPILSVAFMTFLTSYLAMFKTLSICHQNVIAISVIYIPSPSVARGKRIKQKLLTSRITYLFLQQTIMLLLVEGFSCSPHKCIGLIHAWKMISFRLIIERTVLWRIVFPVLWLWRYGIQRSMNL